MSAYDFTDTLAVQILTYKKEHNETAAQFAKGCGVSATTIRRIENGDANVKLSTADKLLCLLQREKSDREIKRPLQPRREKWPKRRFYFPSF